MDSTVIVAIFLFIVMFLVTIYLVIDVRSSGSSEGKNNMLRSQKTRKKRKDNNALDDMTGRLQSLISDLDSTANKDKMMQDITKTTQTPMDKLKKNTIDTLKDNNIEKIQVFSISAWIVITSGAVLGIIKTAGIISTLFLLLSNMLLVFNILNMLSMVKRSSRMRETYNLIEQNTNHYQSSKNFTSSVETTVQAMKQGSWSRKQLERFLSKMIGMGNFPLDRALEELKKDLGNSRYVNIYLDRVHTAETTDTQYKKTVNGISGLYLKQVTQYQDFTRAMGVGMGTLVVLTVAMIVLLLKSTVMVRGNLDAGQLSAMSKITAGGTAGILISNLIFFFSTQPNQEKEWGGLDD